MHIFRMFVEVFGKMIRFSTLSKSGYRISVRLKKIKKSSLVFRIFCFDELLKKEVSFRDRFQDSRSYLRFKLGFDLAVGESYCGDMSIN